MFNNGIYLIRNSFDMLLPKRSIPSSKKLADIFKGRWNTMLTQPTLGKYILLSFTLTR